MRAQFRLAAALVLAAVSACTSGAGGPRFADVAAQLPAVAPDRGRIFFYRDYELYDSLGRPYITLNGAVAGISEPGGVLYRDVAPGRYLIAVRNSGPYPDQDKTVQVAGGQTVFAKIESLKSYNSGFESYEPDTFVVVIIDPEQGRRDVAPLRYFSTQ